MTSTRFVIGSLEAVDRRREGAVNYRPAFLSRLAIFFSAWVLSGFLRVCFFEFCVLAIVLCGTAWNLTVSGWKAIAATWVG